MYPLIIKPKAIEMAKEAFEWYNKQQEGLGDLFLTELESCYDKLESSPTAYSKIKRNYRQLVLHTFPYVIVFEIIKKGSCHLFYISHQPQSK